MITSQDVGRVEGCAEFRKIAEFRALVEHPLYIIFQAFSQFQIHCFGKRAIDLQNDMEQFHVTLQQLETKLKASF